MRFKAMPDPSNNRVQKKNMTELERTINGGIELGGVGQLGNVKGSWIKVTTPAVANTDFTINHRLGFVPNGYDVKKKSAPCDVYLGSVDATDSETTLRATATGVELTLFVH